MKFKSLVELKKTNIRNFFTLKTDFNNPYFLKKKLANDLFFFL